MAEITYIRALDIVLDDYYEHVLPYLDDSEPQTQERIAAYKLLRSRYLQDLSASIMERQFLGCDIAE